MSKRNRRTFSPRFPPRRATLLSSLLYTPIRVVSTKENRTDGLLASNEPNRTEIENLR